MPGYYESNGNNVRVLPYYLANLGSVMIYYYTFDLYTATTEKNTVSSNTITLPVANAIGYNVLNPS